MHVFVCVLFLHLFLMQQTLINIQKILAREKHKKNDWYLFAGVHHKRA